MSQQDSPESRSINPSLGHTHNLVDLSDEEASPEMAGSSARTRNRPRRSTSRVSYQEDSDEEEVQKEKAKKIIESSCMMIDHEDLSYCLPDVPAKMNHLTFTARRFEAERFTKLFDACGHQIESLSFESMSLEMFQKIATSCPKLKILTLRPECDENSRMHQPLDAKFTFQKLTKLSIPGSSGFMNKEENFDILFSSMPKTLETFHFTFTKLADVDKILGRIEVTKNFRNLKSLVIEYAKRNDNGEEEVTLQRKEIKLITRLELKQLETLELNCGIWEDVTGRDLEDLLSKFSSTLKHFTIAGNVSGKDMADQTLKLTIVKMLRLVSLSIGVVYEFEEEVDTGEDEGGTSRPPGGHVPLISLDKTELISIEVDILPSLTLESLSLGNLVHIKEISPKRFPELKRLHIGSNWMMILDLSPTVSGDPPQFPVFPLVRELQFPDCFQDEFFMEKIPEMFPVLKKVTMKLPSVRCLRRFFNVMHNSRLTALHLITSYDFDGMLETAICAKPGHPEQKGDEELTSRPFADERYIELKKLENPDDHDKVFLNFVKSKGIELPIPTVDSILDTPYGVGDLKELKSLVIGHVRKTIRIPLNNTLPHDHAEQKFHSFLKIGFREYPLSKRFFRVDLKQLRTSTEFRAAPNIRVPEKHKNWNLVSYKGQSGCKYKDRNQSEGSDDEELEGMLYQEVAGMDNVDLSGSKSTNNRKRKHKVARQNVNFQAFKVKVKKEEPGEVKMEFKTEAVKKEIKRE